MSNITPEIFWAIIGASVASAALLVGMGQLYFAIHPVWSERKRRRLLRDKFSRGPYDERTIERATRYYIRPKCSNIDPGQEKELRHALAATREDLFDKVDYLLDHDDSHRHVLILADSGTGKTSFVLNYYAHNAHRSRSKRHNIALVPLGVKDADELIKNIPDQAETVLFLDALDEDTKAIADHHQRIRELMDMCYKFKCVIMTCRTQFFPRDEEIPINTGIVRLGPRQAGDKGEYEFWKLYLSPLDDEDVSAYVKKRYPIWQYPTRNKALNIAHRIPLLSARPMLLAHIPDLIQSNITVHYVYELYEVMINAWLEREKAWVDKQALREFSERLAVDIYVNRENRGMEGVPYEELTKLAHNWNIELQQWQISGRSLLNRDAQGNYKFAHRSIMEYLFTCRLMRGDNNCYHVSLTDQTKQFLVEILGINYPEIYTVNDFIMGSDIAVEENKKNGIGTVNLIDSFCELFNFVGYEEIVKLLHNNAFRNLVNEHTFRRLAACDAFRMLVEDGTFKRLNTERDYIRFVDFNTTRGLINYNEFKRFVSYFASRNLAHNRDIIDLTENDVFIKFISYKNFVELAANDTFEKFIRIGALRKIEYNISFRTLLLHIGTNDGDKFFIENYGNTLLQSLNEINKASKLQIDFLAPYWTGFILRIKPIPSYPVV